MSGISTHVLDTSLGQPAQGLKVSLERALPEGGFTLLSERVTDAQGRITDLLAGALLEPASYRLRFATEAYLSRTQSQPFYPHVEIVFRVSDPQSHYHIPLLLSPFGYSTYRGS